MTLWRVRWALFTSWMLLVQYFARTQSFGFSSKALSEQFLLAFVLGVPFGLIALLGVPLRRNIMGIGASVVVAAVLAEGMAQTEELVFLSGCEGVSDVVQRDRWFPLGGHSMLYLPAVDGPLFCGRD